MKRILATFATLFAMTAAIQAMSYEQARQQALFLTDKMAYELNLTEEQYEAAYEVNLDYLMSVNTVDDLYSVYWTRRNLDLSYILFDWQYRAFCDAAYFYRPLYWNAGYWHFRIYTRYPHRNYFYFGRPHFWTVYRGGHSWHSNGGRSWYHGRDFGHKKGTTNHGMRDRYDRGDFKKGGNGRTHGDRFDRNGKDKFNRGGNGTGHNNRGNGRGTVGRQSSTRTTGVQQQRTTGSMRKTDATTSPRNTFTPSRERGTSPATTTQPSTTRSTSTRSSGINTHTTTRGAGSVNRSTSTPTRSSSSFGSSSSRSSSSRSSSSVGSSSSRGSSHSNGSRSGGGHFGGRR